MAYKNEDGVYILPIASLKTEKGVTRRLFLFLFPYFLFGALMFNNSFFLLWNSSSVITPSSL